MQDSTTASMPSAMATARIIEDLGSISYPEGIKSPEVELNVNAKRGKFRYDREFLMQFMEICQDKPDNLLSLDAIGLEPSEQSAGVPVSRGGSQRHSSSAMGPPPPNFARQLQGLGLPNLNGPTGSFTMGKFATPGIKTSEDCFKEASMGLPASMVGGPPGVGTQFGARPSPMVRSSSQDGPSAIVSKRTRSKRDVDRGEANKGGPDPSFGSSSLSQPGMMSLEPVAPLEHSTNRWQPASRGKVSQQVEPDSPDVVDRKVRALLNKLTMERFDSISDQIIAWANKSEYEHDGRTLIQVIRLVLGNATDEARWSEMYARLCRKMMEQISPKVQDEGIKNAEGKPIAGSQLFRKYLLNRCQEDFEHGWAAKESIAAAAATKATEDRAAKVAAEKDEDCEAALHSEEYYAVQKAKRQLLGLIKFLGELFKLQLLRGRRVMHECVKKLLGDIELNSDGREEEIESLCKLLTSVGKSLDTPSARAHMDPYFARMKELTKNGNVNSRSMQFMLLDLVELRERKWVPRKLSAAPSVDSKAPSPFASSHFDKLSKTNSMTLGPTGVFAKERSKRGSSSLSRGSNMFSKLTEIPELAAEAATAQPGRPPSRETSVDLGCAGVPQAASEAPPQRRKANPLPRTLPHRGETLSLSTSEELDSTAPSVSDEEAKTSVGEHSKEVFSSCDLTRLRSSSSSISSLHSPDGDSSTSL